ncbi:LysR family transcriptional regulator [Idiomarina tyrosinivorans]|uniref:LysR family transcriptional regulator n=1 Tax=Idiomarina tyrosinivorans TaxID=1445662 RepID=A0A432ZLJ5_9GAMM|nr:LysR family transcriptional regulator [Idiomarina tyrosinivorans]RUO78846.1 LysR family transcriptional regulator [Idiomarina tyrosinivorans]
MFDITNLAFFAAVAEHQSFSAAARQLQMPKSTLSRRIAELEEQQGIKLLVRTTRRVSLTDVGKEFLRHCQAVVQAAEAAQQVAQFVREKPRGKVRLSCPHSFSQHLLSAIIPQFLADYPEVSLDMVVTNNPVDLVSDQIDIALRVRDQISDASHIVRPLGKAPLTLYASPKLIAEYGEAKHPSDIVDWPKLSLHYSSGVYQYKLTHHQGQQMTLQYQARLITDDLVMLREAAIAGQGLAALPNYICREALAAKQLVRLLPEWSLPTGQMLLVYPYRRGLLPAVRVLIDYLVEKFPEQAGIAGVHDDLSNDA